MYFIENNWEVFGVTSNHYLSDLIGYFYLTWFFKDLKGVSTKHEWCFKELLKEFDKQVFEEGTDYEGSTNYHVLVTEIFYHFYILSQESGFALPEAFLIKLKKMFNFIDRVNVADKGIVKVGDDDSGKILYYGITPALVASMKNENLAEDTFLKEFGLSVHKSDEWHVTLRHHAYTKQQPSGHFHNDIASVTVAHKGIPVIVDPGSYVYTPSSFWRNTFRSAESHNTFYIEDVEPIMFSEESLFVLDIPEHTTTDTMWSARNILYSIDAVRSVVIDKNNNTVDIEDSWEEDSGQGCFSVWNFMLAPDIEPIQHDQQTWYLKYNNKILVTFSSYDLVFLVVSGWYAPSYGTKIACKKLVARCPLTSQPVRIKITGM